MVADKNPVRVAAGRASARKRWGDPRILRLDELEPGARRLVIALVNAAKSEAATEGMPVTAHAEGQANDRAAA